MQLRTGRKFTDLFKIKNRRYLPHFNRDKGLKRTIFNET